MTSTRTLWTRAVYLAVIPLALWSLELMLYNRGLTYGYIAAVACTLVIAIGRPAETQHTPPTVSPGGRAG